MSISFADLAMPATPALRVALFTDTYLPQVNGVARTLARLAKALRERGHIVRVFTTSDPRAQLDADVHRYLGSPFWAYPELRIALPSAALVRRDLERFAPNLVHIATPFGVGLAARTAARELRLPLVTSYHTSLSAYAGFYGLGVLAEPGWAFLRWFHNSGLRTYVPTLAIQREIVARGFINTALWSRGVDTSVFNPRFRDPALRASLGARQGTVLVGYVGRLAREKGLDVALAAMHALRRRYDERRVRFAFAGDGPYEAECRAQAPSGTVFMGRLEGRALSAFYASLDVQVFPSVTDTFGNVLLEGLASGLAIVAANAGPTIEILSPDRGVIVGARDADAFASAVVELVEIPEQRDRLAMNGVAFARTQTWRGIFDRLFADYARLSNVAIPIHDVPLMRASRASAATSRHGIDARL